MLLLGLLGGALLQRACVSNSVIGKKEKEAAAAPTVGVTKVPSAGKRDKTSQGSAGTDATANPIPSPNVQLGGAQKNAPESNGAKIQMPLPRIALVIDDLGQADLALVQRLCNLDVPLTVAVLPFLQHTRESAAIAHQRGKEVILHMPMEPIGYPAAGKNPGPGAILFEQPEAEVRERVRRAMKEIPFAVGLNNHMGSRITPDAEKMAWVLGEVKKSNWYFLDSRTEKDTVALEVARKLGIPSMQRKVFLDDNPSVAEMTHQWERALAFAGQDGQAVVIGHIHPETLAFLEAALPAAKREVKFSYASELAR